MTLTRTALLGLALAAASLPSVAQVQLFEHDNFRGRSYGAAGAVRDLARSGFNDRASSAIVRGGTWILCDDARYGGRCVTLRPGRYRALSAMRLNDRVSSLRPAGRPAPRPPHRPPPRPPRPHGPR